MSVPVLIPTILCGQPDTIVSTYLSLRLDVGIDTPIASYPAEIDNIGGIANQQGTWTVKAAENGVENTDGGQDWVTWDVGVVATTTPLKITGIYQPSFVGTSSAGGFMLRFVDPDNFLYLIIGTNGDKMRLRERVAGVESTLHDVNPVTNIIAGNPHTFIVNDNAERITASIDAEDVIDFTTSRFSSSSEYGLYGKNIAPNVGENIHADLIMEPGP